MNTHLNFLCSARSLNRTSSLKSPSALSSIDTSPFEVWSFSQDHLKVFSRSSDLRCALSCAVRTWLCLSCRLQRIAPKFRSYTVMATLSVAVCIYECARAGHYITDRSKPVLSRLCRISWYMTSYQEQSSFALMSHLSSCCIVSSSCSGLLLTSFSRSTEEMAQEATQRRELATTGPSTWRTSSESQRKKGVALRRAMRRQSGEGQGRSGKDGTRDWTGRYRRTQGKAGRGRAGKDGTGDWTGRYRRTQGKAVVQRSVD